MKTHANPPAWATPKRQSSGHVARRRVVFSAAITMAATAAITYLSGLHNVEGQLRRELATAKAPPSCVARAEAIAEVRRYHDAGQRGLAAQVAEATLQDSTVPLCPAAHDELAALWYAASGESIFVPLRGSRYDPQLQHDAVVSYHDLTHRADLLGLPARVRLSDREALQRAAENGLYELADAIYRGAAGTGGLAGYPDRLRVDLLLAWADELFAADDPDLVPLARLKARTALAVADHLSLPDQAEEACRLIRVRLRDSWLACRGLPYDTGEPALQDGGRG